MVGTGQGLERYDYALTSYNGALQAADEYRDLQDLGAWWLEMPERPSVLLIFDSIVGTTVTLGALLALATRFDLVTREKESRSLKTLLAHPVYRDEIIVGKAFGGAAALGPSWGLSLPPSSAFSSFFPIVPTAGEIVSILLFGAISLLFLIAWFAIALAFSTVTQNSGNALIFVLVIFFVVSSLLPVLGAMVGGLIAGPPPQHPQQTEVILVEMHVSTSAGESFVQRDDSGQQASVWSETLRDYQEDLVTYTEKKRTVTNVITLLSPQESYRAVADLVLTPPGVPLVDSLGGVWAGIVGLIVFPSIFYGRVYEVHADGYQVTAEDGTARHVQGWCTRIADPPGGRVGHVPVKSLNFRIKGGSIVNPVPNQTFVLLRGCRVTSSGDQPYCS